MLPKIKKRIKSFILEEEGRISKQSALKIGAALALSSASLSHLADAQCPPGGCAGAGGCGGSCGCTSEGTY